MSKIPKPSFEHNIEEWKVDRIKTRWNENAEVLSHRWNIDPSIFEDLEIEITSSFGGRVEDNRILLSDPDIYRAGMKQVFDSEDEIYVRNLTDTEYPIPFHEVAEETGQWLGRNYPNNWSMSPDLKDAFVDETFGMLALRETHPEFLKYYRNKFAENLEIVQNLSSRELFDEIEQGNYIEEDFELDEDYQYSRLGNEPDNLAQDVYEIVDSLDYNAEDIDESTLETIRQYKLENESEEWRVYLAASNLALGDKEDLSLEDPELFLKMPSDERKEILDHTFTRLDSSIKNEYDLPQHI